MSNSGRVALVAFLGIWSAGTLWPQIACTWQQCPGNGLATNFDGVVTRVQDGSPAQRAEIVPGDRIVSPLPEGLFRRPPPLLEFRLLHEGAERAVTLAPEPERMTPSDRLTRLALVASYAIFLVVGSGVLLLRPSAMTWAFYLYCLLRRYGDFGFYWAGSSAFFWFNFLAFAALGGASCALVTIFALRFPRDRLTGWRLQVNRFAVGLTFALPVAWLCLFVRVGIFGLPSQSLFDAMLYLTSLVYLGAAAIFVLTLIQSHGEDRQRLRWILVFPIVLVLRVVVVNFQYSLPSWFSVMLIVLAVCIPISVAYAVVRQRVFDVEFAISRALVYAAITSIIAGTFILLDWFMSRQFAQTRFTLTAEIILALAIGSWLNMLHRNVDRFIDSTFFRQRHLAEERLTKAAAAVLRAESREVVDRFLVHEPLKALDLHSAAIFRGSDASGRFIREMAVGWERVETRELTQEDPLVLHLLAEQTPVRLADVVWPSEESPMRLGDSVLAMPVLLRDQLAAIVLYGPHRNGTDIDPDEARAVSLLVERAGAAYDHIEARTLREKVDALMRERDAQRREIELLRASTA
ncbi:MAG TPA: hypothetical protein VFF63_08615 [Candidatus Babeliales bacterium]|nr:hypothetical protein [Candidatus Babeliales bacterium]